MITIIRGADISFNTTFTDVDGNPYSSPTALLNISYSINDTPHTSTITMQYFNGFWHATWNSGVADQGQVDWFVTSSGGVSSVDQGSFLLVKNTANSGS
jgi:hypothetical protein